MNLQKTLLSFIVLISLTNHQVYAFNWQDYTKWTGYGLAGVIGLGWFWHQNKLKYELSLRKRLNEIENNTSESQNKFPSSTPTINELKKALELHGIGYTFETIKNGNASTQTIHLTNKFENAFKLIVSKSYLKLPMTLLTEVEEETIINCLNNLGYEANDLTDSKKATIWKTPIDKPDNTK